MHRLAQFDRQLRTTLYLPVVFEQEIYALKAKMMDQQESSALTLSLHFTSAQFFANHPDSQRVHSAAAGPLTTAMY